MDKVTKRNFISQNHTTVEYYRFCKRLKKQGIKREKRKEYYKKLRTMQVNMRNFLHTLNRKSVQGLVKRFPDRHQKPTTHQIPVQNPERH
jgi:hypothetical protein